MKFTAKQPGAVCNVRETKPKFLIGLIGEGIQLSRTPAMHETAGHQLGLRLTYQLLDTDLMSAPTPSLGELLRFTELFGFCGVNVTHPYKQTVISELDSLSESAEKVGAVNAVVFENGKRVGHNTDFHGFRESFRQNLGSAACRKVVLLGAGGAGVAVAPALLESGVESLAIVETQIERAQLLASRLAPQFSSAQISVVDDINAAIASADGVVNATPVGTEKIPGTPIATELLKSSMWVADIVYFPLETELLRISREMGCQTLSGQGMTVFQAVRAFELFTGHTPDSELMNATFAAFDQQQSDPRQ